MVPRISTLILIILITCGPVLAQDYNFTHDIVGVKTDETSRDSRFINDATTAGDRAAAHAMEEKIPGHVHPQHRVVTERVNGKVTTRDYYFIPDPAQGQQ